MENEKTLIELFGESTEVKARDLDKEPYTQEEFDELQIEFGNYDNPDECPHNNVYPRLGYENSFIGEYCTQCGADLDNSGNVVRYPISMSSTELDNQGKNIDYITKLKNKT